MKSLLFIFAISFNTYCFNTRAQHTSPYYLDSLVNDFATNLKNQGVDTICIFEDYWTTGQPFVVDEKDWCYTKHTYIPVYVLWRQAGKSYLSKKDNCFDYSTTEVRAEAIWKYYFDNREAIKPEKSKPFQLSSTVNGKLSLTTITDDHTGHRNVKVITATDTVKKYFDTFQLQATAKNGNQTEVNINYGHNQKLLSKRLAEFLADFVLEAEKKKLLVRSLR
ncbi:MAG TPA: hypothetical protein VK154_10570 [Chitinophagales bacterium]|nr:hypothetical protein [Chitinophagales bacterium]